MEILEYEEEMIDLQRQYNELVKEEHRLDMKHFRGHIECEAEEEFGSGHLKIWHKDTTSGLSKMITWELY